jgi:hypothetical protein
VVVARDGRPIWRIVESAKLSVRPFSDAWLDAYIERRGEALLWSVGCYELESEGVQLFDQVDGDYFTILGLPLIGLLDFLRLHGALRHEFDPDRRGHRRRRLRRADQALDEPGFAQRLDPGGRFRRGLCPIRPGLERFEAFVDGLRGGAIKGLNVTIPFKERALALADTASDLAKMAGAANLLVFAADGRSMPTTPMGPACWTPSPSRLPAST